MAGDLRSRRAEFLRKQEKETKEGLPHLHGFKWYKWAREFFECTNKNVFLVAGNQLSKSSTQIRKCIHWATETSLWPKLWARRPLVFWYLYPTKEVGTIEFEKKWVPEFLPRGKFKDDPKYGWTEEYKAGMIHAVHFKSGVSVYFKTYATDVKNLQTGTCSAIFADEELVADLYDELNMRRAATDGYFNMVFTATIGQELWRLTMEPEKGEKELFPDAAKWRVSIYDCLTYEDGSPSGWTEERINRIKNSCKSEAEVQKRVYGRFVSDSGLKYPSFNAARNVGPGHPLPANWNVYVGIDIGGGGKQNHPSAITFVAVSPDFTKGRVIKGWRGDNVETNAYDVLLKYVEMKKGMNITAAYYDYASKEFAIIASRNGVPVLPADKTHETGERVLNVLFKNQMLVIYDKPELQSLIAELKTLKQATPKTHAVDDYIDSLRYATSQVPWDFTIIQGDHEIKPQDHISTDDELRRSPEKTLSEQIDCMASQELEEWNELY
jgi:hypothetical protein